MNNIKKFAAGMSQGIWRQPSKLRYSPSYVLKRWERGINVLFRYKNLVDLLCYTPTAQGRIGVDLRR